MMDIAFTPFTLTGFALASFAGSFVSAALGIGGGAFLLAIFASILPPAALIPVHGVVQLGSNLSRVLVMRSWISSSILPAFLSGAVIGVVFGGLITVKLPPAFVLIGVGCFILWTLVAKPPASIQKSSFMVGVVSSTLTMFFGATGPFVAAWIKTLSFDRMTHVATQATCMTLQHAIKTVMFALLGFAFQQWWLPILLMIAAGFVGTIVGKAVLTRIDDKKFKIALNIMLVVLSLRLIWQGVSILLQPEL